MYKKKIKLCLGSNEKNVMPWNLSNKTLTLTSRSLFSLKPLLASSKGHGLYILMRVEYNSTNYKALREANIAKVIEKIRLSLLLDPKDPFVGLSRALLLTLGDKTPRGTGIVVRPERETSSLPTSNKSIADARSVVRTLFPDYLLFLT
jgi:hypothetical protein